MRKDLIAYPEAPPQDPYTSLPIRIYEEPSIAGGVTVNREILSRNKENLFEHRYCIVEGFRKTFYWKDTLVRIPSDSERKRITSDLLKRLNSNPFLPPVDCIFYAHPAQN